jgi:hypothetical protein
MKDLLYRPIRLLEKEKGFDRAGEAVIIDVNKLILEGHFEIEYIFLSRNNVFFVLSETIKETDAEESIELLDKFSSKWKRAMTRISFTGTPGIGRYVYNKIVLQELTDTNNIEDYNLNKYF